MKQQFERWTVVVMGTAPTDCTHMYIFTSEEQLVSKIFNYIFLSLNQQNPDGDSFKSKQKDKRIFYLELNIYPEFFRMKDVLFHSNNIF